MVVRAAAVGAVGGERVQARKARVLDVGHPSESGASVADR
jgi:hypothetical protein